MDDKDDRACHGIARHTICPEHALRPRLASSWLQRAGPLLALLPVTDSMLNPALVLTPPPPTAHSLVSQSGSAASAAWNYPCSNFGRRRGLNPYRLPRCLNPPLQPCLATEAFGSLDLATLRWVCDVRDSRIDHRVAGLCKLILLCLGSAVGLDHACKAWSCLQDACKSATLKWRTSLLFLPWYSDGVLLQNFAGRAKEPNNEQQAIG